MKNPDSASEASQSSKATTISSDAQKSEAMTAGETFFRDKLVERNESAKTPGESAEDQWTRVAKNVGKSAAAPDDIEDWAVVVDDSPASLTVIAGILKSLNIGVHTFREPVSALKFLKEASEKEVGKILIFFSDLDMPKMDGIDYLRELKKSPRTQNIPFVLVSGSIERKYLPRLSMNRPDGIVIKPFSAGLIVDQVMKATVARQKHTLKIAE